jgi:hypothetical protein
MIKKLVGFLLVFMIAEPVAAAAVPAAESASTAHRVAFAFHSAFLMNLHHFLYDMAVHKDKLAAVAWESAPTAEELRTLQQAIAFYRAHYGELGIREAPILIDIKRALSVDDAQCRVAGLGIAPALAAVLDQAAPVYARRLWPAHHRSNRAWIARVTALDLAYGAEVQAGIEHQMEASFPPMPIRTDVVFDTGSRQGAYTDEQIVIPSARRIIRIWLRWKCCITKRPTPL